MDFFEKKAVMVELKMDFPEVQVAFVELEPAFVELEAELVAREGDVGGVQAAFSELDVAGPARGAAGWVGFVALRQNKPASSGRNVGRWN